MSKIVLDAYFSKAQTTVDGGWRLSFDILQSQAHELTEISALRDQALKLVIMTDDELAERPKVGAKKGP